LNYRIGPRRPGDVEQIWADTTKAEQELGWKAKMNLEDMMRSAWKWQKGLEGES
jgi:UDP-glucose 4-epimerase